MFPVNKNFLLLLLPFGPRCKTVHNICYKHNFFSSFSSSNCLQTLNNNFNYKMASCTRRLRYLRLRQITMLFFYYICSERIFTVQRTRRVRIDIFDKRKQKKRRTRELLCTRVRFLYGSQQFDSGCERRRNIRAVHIHTES